MEKYFFKKRKSNLLIGIILVLVLLFSLLQINNIKVYADNMPSPLTFTAVETNSSVTFNWYSGDNVEFCYGDFNWKPYTSGTEIKLESLGDTVQFRGQGVITDKVNHFVMSGKIVSSGDVTSLINGIGGDVNLTQSCFAYMFSECESLIKAPNLPSTTLAPNCYSYMFEYCDQLTEAPKLPASKLSDSCYGFMFYNCNNLHEAPELPATNLNVSCYTNMFNNCINLTEAPKLPATSLEKYCYQSMFENCDNLIETPELPATTLADGCYISMFKNCSSLKKASELPATSLCDRCYFEMFKDCNKLEKAPELPATNLSTYCYYSMFYNCSSLHEAPELPATIMKDYCYLSMFFNCNNLIKVPTLRVDILADLCFNNMFSGCNKLIVTEVDDGETWSFPDATTAKYCISGMISNISGSVKTVELGKKYKVSVLKETWNYEYQNNEIIAHCTGDECGFVGFHFATLSLKSGENVYTGNTEYINSIIDLSIWKNGEIPDVTVKYKGIGDTVYDESTVPPTDAGIYSISVTAEDEVTNISSYFIIKKAESVLAKAPSPLKNIIYDCSEKVLLDVYGETKDGIIQYSLEKDGIYSPSVPKATNAGTYNIYYKIVGDKNHSDKIFDEPITVTINKAIYSGDKKIEARINSNTDSKVVLPVIPDHMAYGTPSFSKPITNAAINDGILKFSTDDTVKSAALYTIDIPVKAISGESANYNDYTITVILSTEKSVQFATDYDTLNTVKIINSKGKMTGITISSNYLPDKGILTVPSKLKLTLPNGNWKLAGYSEEKVTPESLNTAKWLATENTKTDLKLLKKYAKVKNTKANKNKEASTVVTAGLNKKDKDGVYAVKLIDDQNHEIILNIECIKLVKLGKKDTLKTSVSGNGLSAKDILSIADGDNAKTIAFTYSGKDKNFNKSAFNKNSLEWNVGSGNNLVTVKCDNVTEYKNKQGQVIAYLTLCKDGSVKVLAGEVKGKIKLTASLNNKKYSVTVNVK